MSTEALKHDLNANSTVNLLRIFLFLVYKITLKIISVDALHIVDHHPDIPANFNTVHSRQISFYCLTVYLSPCM